MVEGADLLVAEQSGDRLWAVRASRQIAPGELAADLIQELLEARPLLGQPSAERAAARAEAEGDAVEKGVL